MSRTGNQVVFSDIFSLINFIKIGGTALIAFAVVWLNSEYVSQTDFKRVVERVSVLENKQAAVDKQLPEITILMKNIDRRLSNIITEDGRILYDSKVIGLDIDMRVMQQDIQYIKKSVQALETKN